MRLFAGDRIYKILDRLGTHRRGGQRGADRGRDALQADREGPAQGRGAELPHPQARARVRRRDEPAARGRLQLPRRDPRGPRHGRRRRASEIAERDRAPGRGVHRRATSSRTGTSRACSRRSRRSSRRAPSSTEIDARPDRPRGAGRAPPGGGRRACTTAREEELGDELMRALERFLLLQIIDQRWREHLYDMDYLREGIHLRGFAQIEPLVAYKNEAFKLFRDLMNTIWADFARDDLPRRGRDRGPERRRAAAVSSAGRARARARARGSRSVTYSGGAAAQPSALADGRRGRAPRPQALRRGGRRRARRAAARRPTTSRSAATTPAGAGRARSTRSATAPSAPAYPWRWWRTNVGVILNVMRCSEAWRYGYSSAPMNFLARRSMCPSAPSVRPSAVPRISTKL